MTSSVSRQSHKEIGNASIDPAVGIIPVAIENDSYVRWCRGRDCGPRSVPEISAKAPRGKVKAASEAKREAFPP